VRCFGESCFVCCPGSRTIRPIDIAVVAARPEAERIRLAGPSGSKLTLYSRCGENESRPGYRRLLATE
jgi:hypothetical protein